MKKILMLYPEFPNTFWSFRYALKFVHKRAAFPPLGLLTVAAMLPEAWEKCVKGSVLENTHSQLDAVGWISAGSDAWPVLFATKPLARSTT